MNRLGLLLFQFTFLAFVVGCAAPAPKLEIVSDGLKPWQRSTQAADKLVAQGEYDLALKKAVDALKEVTGQTGEFPGEEAIVRSKIGQIHRLMYDHSRSEEYYIRAVKLTQQAVGQDHPDYAKPLLGLGLAYHHQQRRENAIRILRWALAIVDKHLGPANAGVNPYLIALAVAYEDALQFEQSMPLRERSMNLLTRIHGANSKESAEAQWRMAVAARSSGNSDIAAAYFDKSLASYQTKHGQTPELASKMEVAAENYSQGEQFKPAEKLLTQALSIRIRSMGYDHPEVVGNFEALAALYASEGRIDDALQYREYASKARNGIDPYK